MKSLELKALKMNDNFPLIISLNGKVEWELDDNKDIVDSHLVGRDDARCTFSTISQIMLYPSSETWLIAPRHANSSKIFIRYTPFF